MRSSAVRWAVVSLTSLVARGAGRNIHALDPYRMPGAAALQRGAAVADSILASHKAANSGTLPQTVSVNLWGLDAIKTKAITAHLARGRLASQASPAKQTLQAGAAAESAVNL